MRCCQEPAHVWKGCAKDAGKREIEYDRISLLLLRDCQGTPKSQPRPIFHGLTYLARISTQRFFGGWNWLFSSFFDIIRASYAKSTPHTLCSHAKRFSQIYQQPSPGHKKSVGHLLGHVWACAFTTSKISATKTLPPQHFAFYSTQKNTWWFIWFVLICHVDSRLQPKTARESISRKRQI